MKELVEKYFAKISDNQKEKIIALVELYRDWNAKINVVSRKDIDNLAVHHILHSLSIYKYVKFAEGSKILDLGTGGGFPGVPLAILNPKVNFRLVDSIGKKLKVVDDIAARLELKNIQTSHDRVENIKEKVDFVVCRAVSSFEKLLPWTKDLILKKQINSIPNGMIALKGGDISTELNFLKRKTYHEVTKISEYFDESFFDEKFIIYIQY